MSKNINSAYRILLIIDQIRRVDDKMTTVDVWCKHFSIDAPSPNERFILVSQYLSLVDKELAKLKKSMLATEYSTELYDPYLIGIQNCISLQNLQASWGNYKNNITSEIILCLRFWREILPDEEDIIPEDELRDIINQITILEASVAEADIPDTLKHVISQHIEIIKNSIKKYKVQGVVALKDASEAVIGNIILNKDILKENQNTEQVGKLGSLWKKLGVLSDNAAKIEKVVSLGSKAWDLLEKIPY